MRACPHFGGSGAEQRSRGAADRLVHRTLRAVPAQGAQLAGLSFGEFYV